MDMILCLETSWLQLGVVRENPHTPLPWHHLKKKSRPVPNIWTVAKDKIIFLWTSLLWIKVNYSLDWKLVAGWRLALMTPLSQKSKQKVEATITLAKRHTDTECCTRKHSFTEGKEIISWTIWRRRNRKKNEKENWELFLILGIDKSGKTMTLAKTWFLLNVQGRQLIFFKAIYS